jgi:hypothetical protein
VARRRGFIDTSTTLRLRMYCIECDAALLDRPLYAPPGGQPTTIFVLRPSPTLTVPHQTNARVSNLCEFLVPFVAAEAPSTFITRETRRQQWPKISVMETGRRVVCRRRVSVNRCVELSRVYIVVSGARGRRGRVEGGRLPTTLFRGRWISRDS